MTFSLNDGVTYCSVAGQSVFLDVGRDQYFGLGADSERAFQEFRSGDVLGADTAAALRSIVVRGLLIESECWGDFAQPVDIKLPERSAFYDESGRGDFTGCVAALRSHVWAGMMLKVRSLKTVLRSVQKRQQRGEPLRMMSDADGAALVHAFRVVDRFAPDRQRCLQRSVAVARYAAERGLRVNVVFGVRINPFLAHCWVQDENVVLTDCLSRVRTFTPILVV